jgi:hypothetical protein
MKKNKLIELLQNIKGNPEIKLWNSMVGDWMDIRIVESELVKESEEFFRWQLEAQWTQDNKVWDIPAEVQRQLDEKVQHLCKKREWDFANPYVSLEDEKRWYDKKRKKILLIDGKKRGKIYYDRIGKISY